MSESSAVRYTFASAAGFVVAAALAAPASRYFEGYVSRTYRDPVGIPTACWGETGPHIGYGMEFSLEQCIRMHDASLARTWRALSCISVPLQPRELAAILSWAHNVGTGAACSSTLARMIRSGAPPDAWCPQLTRWTYGTVLGVKVQLPGLVTRRGAELHMCLTGTWGLDAIDAHLPPVPAPEPVYEHPAVIRRWNIASVHWEVAA